MPPARLLSLHRNHLIHVLLLGGDPAGRLVVARKIHADSPLRLGPFLAIESRCQAGRLDAALRDWCTLEGGAAPNPLRGAERGTLFLDSVTALPTPTQRLLLAFLRQLQSEALGGPGFWSGRMIFGSDDDPAIAVAESRFPAALLDIVDKLRVELPERHVGAA